MATFDKYDDIIDSRDVIARIEELEAEREALQKTVYEWENAIGDTDEEDEKQAAAEELGRAEIDLEEWDASDAADELRILKALADAASGYAADWHYGETLIRDSYFTDYAMQLAEEIASDEMRDRSWPYNCIDWDQAARELQMDYTAVDFDGVTYWIR